MAYAVKWFSEFSDIGDTRIEDSPCRLYRVEIIDRDYSGSPIEVLSGSNPCVVELAVGKKDLFRPIVEQKATIEWISDLISGFDISDLFITDDKRYQVKLYEFGYESLQLLWWGHLVPIDCQEPFLSKPYPVQMSATCGLPFLSDGYFLTLGGSFPVGKLSLIKIIANCLTTTGLALDIDTYIDLEAVGMSGGALAGVEIDSDGLRGESPYQVLEKILNAFPAFITQSNGRWVIKGKHEQSSLTASLKRYNSAGDLTFSGVVNHSASFGRTVETDIPWLTPTSEVNEILAEPNSKVTETVSPGIPVNRLPNGQFSGVVLSGNIPGWNNNTSGAISWMRGGLGTPDSPYRLEMTSPVYVDYKKASSRYPITPDAYFDTGPIMINVGEFNLKPEERTDLKLIFAGAIKAHGFNATLIYLTINESERKGVSWLESSGEWFYSTKYRDSRPITISPIGDRDNTVKTYEDLELQSFEIESKEITNFIKSGSEGIAYIRLRIYPGGRYIGHTDPNAFLSLEDLSITFNTGLVYEGEHKYQADSKLPIRDANELSYTIGIADKINIDTPEQRRDVNRVMTGYMTLAGTNTLTSGWKYPSDAGYEPIQLRNLRERIRQVNGKRREISGEFFGYGLRPDQSGFYSNESDSNFFAVTGWKWDVKYCSFETTFHELSVAPLIDEDIYLYDDETGRRGNRMYRGNSSTNAGGQGEKNIEEIVLDPIAPLYYTVGELGIKLAPLEKYIQSTHIPFDLDAEIKYDPDWITNVVIDRGEDGDVLWVAATGTPLVPGTDRILVELIGFNGEDYLANIPIIAVPATKLTHYLIDTGSNTVVGKIKAGSGYMKPDSWRIDTVVDGFHEGYFQSVNGPGVSYSSAIPYEEVLPTSEGEYSTDSQVGAVGVYSYNFATFRNEGDPLLFAEVKEDAFNFTLYDEAYLNKAKFELWIGASKFGDIDPDGSSAFNTEGQAFQVKIVIEGLERDYSRLVLDHEGVQVHTRNFSHVPSVTDSIYNLYAVLPSPQPKGYYELSFEADEESVLVYDRIIGFTINEKKKEPIGGSLTLVAMRPGQSAYDELGTLSISGNLFTLPASPGWNVLDDSPVVPGLTRSHKLFQKRAGALVEINTSLYSGIAQSKTYLDDSDEGDYLIFGTNGSTTIDKIHGNNTSFRVIITDEVDGVVTEIKQGDFSFGTLEDLDDLEVEEPGSVTYVPGHAMGATTVNNVTAFNWRPDGVTLEVFEAESPDETGGLLNHARIKNKGVTFAKIQDIPGKHVIGNPTGSTGVTSAIKIADFETVVDPGDIVTVTYLEQILGEAIEGTAGYLAKFGGDGIVDSVVREVSGNIGIGISPTQKLHVAGNVLATQLQSNVATGTAPLTVASSTLVTNLHADFLNKSVIAGNGLIGGGILTADRTVSMGTPSTLSNVTTNATTTDSHTHAVTTGSLNQGTNIVLSGDIGSRLIGSGNVTISAPNVYTKTESDALFTDKEDVFSKGNIVESSGVNLSGTLTNRLVGSGDVTIALQWSGVSAGTYRSVTVDLFGRVTGGTNPTTLTDYGLSSTVYTKTEVNNILAGYVPESRTITINGSTQDLSANRTWNVGTVTGSGTTGYFPKFTSATALGDSVMRDTGAEINIASSRSFGVEGPAAMRDYLHVHDYLGIGKSGQHGALVIHSASSATAHASAAIDVQSTTKGIGFPVMTKAQREAIPSPRDGLFVYQSNVSGTSLAGLKFHYGGLWAHVEYNLTDT